MNTPAQTLAHGIRAATNAFLFFSADIDGPDWTHRVCKDASCAAWITGHLILSSRQMMKAMGIDPAIELPDGFEQRFGRGENAPAATDFGDPSILKPLFKAHHDALAAGVEGLTPEKLAEKLEKPRPLFGTVGELAAFAPIHMALHLGQISTIRRSLGRPPVL
jgi:hypothetical protein